MAVCKINLLETLLKTKIMSYKTEQLTEPGDNYGSAIIGIDITTKDDNGVTKTLQCVVKMCPTNEWTKKMFNTPVTFKKEVRFYSKILPVLHDFQVEQGVIDTISSLVPVCFGSRLTLNPNCDNVDDDAVIVLENLKMRGFVMFDRMLGFDFETTKIILENLASFHAVPIALKQLRPNIFYNKIQLHLENSYIFEIEDEVYDRIIEGIVAVVSEVEECRALISNVQEGMKRGIKNKNQPPISDLLATVSHNDFWINNIMLKVRNNKAIRSLILDFQMIEYQSAVNDLIFFLYTSVQTNLLDEYYNEFLNIYYQAFLNSLEQLKCDTGVFTRELFLKEIDMAARNKEFYHIMVMLKPIYTLKNKTGNFSQNYLIRNDNLHEQYVPKVCKVIKDFAKKGWI